MKVLVSDSSVLIDLLRYKLILQLTQLPYEFIITDITLESEMFKYNTQREDLLSADLVVEGLTGEEMVELIKYRSLSPGLSEADSSALVLAESRRWSLMAGDSLMRNIAKSKRIQTYGTLWVIDEYIKYNLLNKQVILKILQRMKDDPRIRLPLEEIQKRIRLLLKELGR